MYLKHRLDLVLYLYIARILMYHKMTHRAKIIIVKISEFYTGLTSLETCFLFIHRAETVSVAVLQALSHHHPLQETIVKGKWLLSFTGWRLQSWVIYGLICRVDKHLHFKLTFKEIQYNLNLGKEERLVLNWDKPDSRNIHQ